MFKYPKLNNNNFANEIFNKEEFFQNKYDKNNIPIKIDDTCNSDKFPLLPQQLFLRNYLSHKTPYKSLLIFHGTGAGKTLTSISIAEGLKSSLPYSRKKIFILCPASLILNYKKEISKYYKNIYDKKILNPQINTIYEIMSYQKFANIIKKLNDTEINDFYSERTIIVDEVHNLKEYGDDNFNAYQALENVLKKSKHHKLILMSATPMYDNPNEIKNILKLILLNENDNKNIKLLNNNNLKSEQDFENLKKISNGFVSYLRSEHPGAFAERIYNGTIPKPFLNNTKIIPVEMSKIHTDIYQNLKVDDKNQQFYRQKSNIMNDNYSSTDLLIENLLDKNNSVSRKLGKLVDNIIKNQTKKHFIFSEFKKNGAKLINSALIKNNIKNVFLVTGDNNKEEKDKIIKKFNNLNQAILIGTDVVKEGVSLQNVQNVHIFEPWFNKSKIDQIIGRALRYCSHKDLPHNERFVNIFQYSSVYPNIKLSDFNFNENMKYSELKNVITYDIYALRIAENKDIIIKKIERILKSVSIDCLLNYEYNLIDDKFDNTRTCDYQSCKYSCVSNDNFTLDSSTMNKLFVQPYIDILSKEITNFISNNFIINYQQIELIVNKLYEYYNDLNFKYEKSKKYIIQNTLINIIPNSSTNLNLFPYKLYNPILGKNGYIIMRGKFLLFQPFDDNKIPSISNNENIEFHQRIIKKNDVKKISLKNYLTSIEKIDITTAKTMKLETDLNIFNYGPFIGIVIKKPFVLKFLQLKPNMNIQNFRGTKYNTLSVDFINMFFDNLYNIYKKFERSDSKIFKQKFQDTITKKQKGFVIFELLLKMNSNKIDDKKWIYYKNNDIVDINDFK